MCMEIMVQFGLNYSGCVRILAAQHLRCVQGLHQPADDAACMPGAWHPVTSPLSTYAGCHRNHLFLCILLKSCRCPPPQQLTSAGGKHYPPQRHPCYLSGSGSSSICRFCTSGGLSGSRACQSDHAVLCVYGSALKSQRTSEGVGVGGGMGWGSCIPRLLGQLCSETETHDAPRSASIGAVCDPSGCRSPRGP